MLGLLREGFRYGHEIDKIIEKRHIRLWTKATRASIYQTLTRLTKKGWVETKKEKIGKMPERTVYQLTDQGEAALSRMVREGLEQSDLPNFEYAVQLMFMGVLPDKQALAGIAQRRESFRSLLERLPPVENYDHEQENLIRRALLRFLRSYTELELDWLEWVSEEMRKKAERTKG